MDKCNAFACHYGQDKMRKGYTDEIGETFRRKTVNSTNGRIYLPNHAVGKPPAPVDEF